MAGAVEPPPSAGPVAVETDVCVYGGTSSGVIAAVQAGRMGKRVVLIVPDGHLGGITTSGLGATDRGSPRTVSGLARAFYRAFTSTTATLESGSTRPVPNISPGTPGPSPRT